MDVTWGSRGVAAALAALTIAVWGVPWAGAAPGLVTPTALTASVPPSAPTTVHLTWTDNSNRESGYAVERSLSSASGFTQIATPTRNVVTYDDPGRTPGATYF